MKDNIKLVIWDLDETFWKGTLSEEGITPIQENIELVLELSQRGILNSIVSKNDFNRVKNLLVDLKVWDYFIFPQIEWLPKGELINNVITKAQFKAKNVLFIDDNHLNIEEAKFYNPGINTVYPDFINKIWDHELFKGKSDIELKRLHDYKLLEEKDNIRSNFSDNNEFLMQSDIRIYFIENLVDQGDRVYELLERTNQLNYTKIRLSLAETRALIANENLQNFCIQVKDKYGDYGIVGFVSFDRALNQLIHFVFSCRILNLGIEQYVYSKLGFPKVEIVGEISTLLNTSTPFWIAEEKMGSTKDTKDNLKILFKGGCDLSQMFHYLSNYHLKIIEETNYVLPNNVPTHVEHTEYLKNSLKIDPETLKNLADPLPFINSNAFQTEVFKGAYDVLIYSVLMDYTQDIYFETRNQVAIPFGGYGFDYTKKEFRSEIIKKSEQKGIKAYTESFLDWFAKEYSFSGQITANQFKENLAFIRSKIDSKIPIIFINGAEVQYVHPFEQEALKRHQIMNSALDEFIEKHANCYLLDVRKFVNDEKDIINNIRHYTRPVYAKLADDLVHLLEAIQNKKIKIDWKGKIERKIREKIKSILK